MKGYKEPGFQDRAVASARAKEKALAKLKAAPVLDEAVIAERVARQAERQAKETAKREAARAAKEAAKEQAEREAAERAAAELEEQAAELAAIPTEAEKKAERDARYAARKNRKSGKSR